HQMVGSYGAAICGMPFYTPEFFKPILDIRQKSEIDLVVGLKSTVLGKEILLKPITTYQHLKDKAIDETTIRLNLTYMLINICYENVKDKLDKNKTHHEFFRHLRNASSHGGNFHFIKNEPVNIAEWKGVKIIKSLQGNPMWSIGIGEGDILMLLYEIEQDLIVSTNRIIKPAKPLLN
ncbi:MAG: hypothetical protein ABIP51_06380, partial [Bacteroidia bacterium]